TSGGQEYGISSPSTISTGAWTHLAGTYDGNTFCLYINGNLMVSKAVKVSIDQSSNPLRIGGNSVWGQYFKGYIDEVRIYNGALSAAQIQSDMNTPVSYAPPPTASAGVNQTANEGSAVTFQGSATGSGLTYAWAFGDGGTTSGTLTPTHTYADNGIYTATLTVTDSLGQTSTGSAVVTVNNVAPTATFSASGSATVNNPEAFTFTNQFDPSSVDTAAGITYSYDFNNDGTFEVSNSASASASFTFISAGTYTVGGRIADKDGGY